ncbi:MAG: ACT domain-containing protein [Planctomycetia bacterium]|nr:ACT domain-containing protein [Planctomycetia bacterium]
MYTYVLNIMSDDHPGIIAAVTSAAETLGANIESCSQTVLGGFFTLIMIVNLPEEMPAEKLREHVLNQTAHACQVDISVRQTTRGELTVKQSERFVLTAFGNDQPGVVCRFSEYLADHEMNILDMYGCRQKNADGEVQFLLTAQVEIPSKWNLAMLQCDLQNIGADLNFTVVLQHENIFIATNRVRFR